MISLVLSLCIFILFDIGILKIIKIYEGFKSKAAIIEEINNKEITEEVKANDKELEKNNVKKDEVIWQIEIPSINLIAPIYEGTSQDVMLEFVGHFEETSKWKGNVGLAAHNRGYPINYFAKLKKLKKNDKIIYKTENGTKTYKVELITVIEDTDWSYLGKTKEDKITLITCVENEPTKRLCIQGKILKK